MPMVKTMKYATPPNGRRVWKDSSPVLALNTSNHAVSSSWRGAEIQLSIAGGADQEPCDKSKQATDVER